MTKTTTANYLSIAAPGNSFNARISADSDIFARNDIDALGDALDLHDHSSGKGLIVQTLNAAQVAGDVFYATAANTLARLGIGAAFQLLQTNTGATAPAWVGGFSVISTTTLGADTANITFSSISAAYKHLLLFIQARGDGAVVTDSVALQFNGDTAANYDRQQISANNATLNSAAVAADTKIGVGVFPGASVARASIVGASLILIPSYAATTFEKSVLSMGGYADSTVANSFLRPEAGSWRSTAAITSIKLAPVTSANFKLGSTATLIGLSI